MKLCKDCKNRGKKHNWEFYAIASNYAKRCKDSEPQKQTNADRIRSMSYTELAAFLESVENAGYRDESVAGNKGMLEWLQSEVEG